jgi:hypothetical protein
MNNIAQSTSTQDIRGSPQCGATSTNSSSSLLVSSNLLTCTKPQIQLHKGQEICAHFARSSFPKLDQSTKPYTVCLHQALTKRLHLALQASTRSCTKPYYSCTKPITTHLLLTSPSYLFIHYKRGLNMGKTHGPTSHTRYINPKIPKKPAKWVRSRDLHFAWVLRLRPACRSPKNGQT